jgi:WD40 repeat protein
MPRNEEKSGRYVAFISYSHRDRQMAIRIHRALERIAIPKDLFTGASDFLKSRTHLKPVFLDKDELPSASSLPGELKRSLAASEFLIVVCSPSAAFSKWVNEEISYFRSLGRADRILCVVVGGKPMRYSDEEQDGAFPPALFVDGGEDPIAADLTGDGASISREALRLGAGILGVAFDQLYQRDLKRRRRLYAGIAMGAIITAGVIVTQTVRIYQSAATIAVRTAESTSRESIVLAKQSDAAFQSEAYEKAAAIAIEGMPDANRGLDRPLVPEVQAALSRALWQMRDQVIVGRPGGALVIAPTQRGVIALHYLNERDFAVVAEDGTQLGLVEGRRASPTVIGAIDPTGHYVAMGAADGLVSIWEVSGKRVGVVQQHTEVIGSMEFSPDGSSLLVASRDGLIANWGLDGTPILQLRPDIGGQSAVFSSDGTQILTGANHRVDLWDKVGNRIWGLDFGNDVATSVDLHPSRGLAAIGLTDGTVRIWAVGAAEQQKIVTGQQYPVYVEFSPDGTLVLSRGVDGSTRVWDLYGNLKYSTKDISMAVRFDGDGSILSTSGPSRVPLSEHSIKRLGLSKDIRAYDISPDGARIVTASSSYSRLSLWTIDGEQLPLDDAQRDQMWSVRFDARGEDILTSEANGLATIWKPDGTAVDLQTGAKTVWYADFDPTGRYIVTLASEGTSQLWSRDGKLIRRLENTGYPVRSDGPPKSPVIVSYDMDRNWHKVSFNADGSLFVTITGDNVARLWDDKGDLKATLAGHGDRLWTASFVPDGSAIVTTAEDRTVRFWDLNGKQTKEIPLGQMVANEVQFTGSGTEALVRYDNSSLAKIDITNGTVRLITFPPGEAAMSAALAPDGRSLIVAMPQKVSAWDLDGNKLFEVTEGYDKIARARDGTFAIAVNGRGVAILPFPRLGQQLVDDARIRLTRCLSPEDRSANFLPPIADGQDPLTYCLADPGKLPKRIAYQSLDDRVGTMDKEFPERKEDRCSKPNVGAQIDTPFPESCASP